MNDALYIAATGLQAHQSHVETIANNLANVSTAGFKRGTVAFRDILQSADASAAPESTDAAAAMHLRGVGVSAALKDFAAGELRRTESPMDVALRGDGFLEVQLIDGTRGYTRAGAMTVTKEGLLATAAGQPLWPAVHVGASPRSLTIAADGTVTGSDAAGKPGVSLGRIEAVSFGNPAGLEALGDGVYRATDRSGDALPIRLGEAGGTSLAQGFIEGSNVKLVDEMVNLMVAQRSYEMSVKVIQAADEMAAMSNNLRR